MALSVLSLKVQSLFFQLKPRYFLTTLLPSFKDKLYCSKLMPPGIFTARISLRNRNFSFLILAMKSKSIAILKEVSYNPCFSYNSFLTNMVWCERLLMPRYNFCLLYTSDAADDLLCVDLGGRR